MKVHHPPCRVKNRISRSNALIQDAANGLKRSRALDVTTERIMTPNHVYFQDAISNTVAHTITGTT